MEDILLQMTIISLNWATNILHFIADFHSVVTMLDLKYQVKLELAEVSK